MTNKKKSTTEIIESLPFTNNDKRELVGYVADSNDNDVNFVYKKFSDAKRKIDSIYISIALKNSKIRAPMIQTLLSSIK